MNFKGKGCKNKGITLIALVITIIVLLILAGVTIAMLSGDNSAPQKATEAAQKDAIAGAKDEIAMEVQEALLNYYNNTYVEGDGTKEKSIQEVVSGAASTAVENAKKRNSQLLNSSGVADNTIKLNTKSYTVTGKIDGNGGIIWSDTGSKENESNEEPNKDFISDLQKQGYSVGITKEGHILGADTQDKEVMLYEYNNDGSLIKQESIKYTDPSIFEFNQDTGAITGIRETEQMGYYQEDIGINMGGLTELVIPRKINGIEVKIVCLDTLYRRPENGYMPVTSKSDLIGITKVIVPNTVIEIDTGAFKNCEDIEIITLPNNLKKIGIAAFWGCTKLNSIVISSQVTDIENDAFGNDKSLTNIIVNDENNTYSSYKGVLFNKEQTKIIECPYSKTTFAIPNSMTIINYSAFQGCENLSEVKIPSSVTNIETYAFYGCKSLNSIEIPNSVESIGNCAFGDCTSLNKVWIPSSVKRIGSDAFYHIAEDAIIYVEDEQVKQLLIASEFSDENRIKVGSYPSED